MVNFEGKGLKVDITNVLMLIIHVKVDITL